MKLDIYQVDAFAQRQFEGNPAAVIPLQQWLPDSIMQKIAAENNLSETAFFVTEGDAYYIRWFTPNKEVKLCGHATLASAFVLFTYLNHPKSYIIFNSLSGELRVSKINDLLALDLPAQPPELCAAPALLIESLSGVPVECLISKDYIAVFENEADVMAITPNFEAMKQLDLQGVIVTAPSEKEDCDFVARFFAPKYGINEDPVTGSAYTELTPYWAKKLGKTNLKAKQLSKRGGSLLCELKGERVIVSGKVENYMTGSIDISLS